jgi:surface antigen
MDDNPIPFSRYSLGPKSAWGGRKAAAILLGCSLSIAACSQDPNQPFSRTTGGAAIGALLGAGTGAAVSGKNRGLGALVGGLVGAAAGGAIGSYLDAQSEARRQAALTEAAQQAERPSAPSAPVRWSNPSQNASGMIRAKSRPTLINGRRCMEVEEQITIRGQPKQVQEMRCEGPDGQWS